MEKIYLKLPWFFQNILVSLVGLSLKLRRSHRVNISENEYSENYEDFHRNEITNLVSKVEKNTYWKKYFYSLKKAKSNRQFFHEFSLLPIIEKSNVKASFGEMLNKDKELIELKTSGTTGSGFVFYTTKTAESIMWEFFERYRKRFDINSGDWCGYFCGRTVMSSHQTNGPFWRINYFGKQIIYSNYHLNDNSISSYINSLNMHQPEWIHGYPSFLSLITQLATQKNIKLNYTPKAVTLGSENCSQSQAKMIESFFSCRVSQLYCQTEGVAMISECESGSLHIDEDFSYVELIPTENKNKYEIVGTSFHNTAIPFIRYRTGDIVDFDNSKCDCGRTSRVINSIDGRSEDYITLKSGVKLGRLDHVFKSLVNVKESQFKQLRDGYLEVYVVKGQLYTNEDEKKLIVAIEARIDLDYQIFYVRKIPRTSSGKLRFVIRE